MESCFFGLAFSSLCSGIKQKCDQTKPQTMSIYKGNNAAHALYWSFVCCLCRTSNFCLCLCMHVYVCLWLTVCACERVSQQQGVEKDEGGRLEHCSAGVGRVVGWQMPEGFIRLEGRGREQQFSGKSIRPKHKHRRASNPGLALHSLFRSFSFLAVAFSCSQSYPSLSPPTSPSYSPMQSAPAPAHLYSMLFFLFLLFFSDSFSFLSVFLVFLLLPCLSVKRSSH